MKRISHVILVLALTLVSASVGLAQETGGPGDGGIYTTKLHNGLRVVVIEDRAAPVVQTAVWYHFGSLDETPGKTGLAHALEHMSFRGTNSISSGGLDDIVARLGAQMNGETTYDYTQFYFVLPADKLDVGLAIEADRMQHLLLRQSDWNIERGAVLNELEGDASSPFFNLLSLVREAAYPGEPNGRTPIGNRADIERASASDIGRYYHTWYAPNNATLVIAGAVDHVTAFAKAQRVFGGIAPKKLPSRAQTHVSAAHAGAVVESELPFPFEVLDLSYAVPGDTEAGEPAISTLATLINNERSPFYQALVQTNIALGIQAGADTQLHGGLLNIFIVLNPGHTGTEAQAVFQATMDRILASGFDPGIVTAAKRLTIADRMFSADSVTGMADLAGYTYGIVGERVNDEDKRLAALTPADLLAAAKTYLRTPTVIGHLRPNAQPARGHSQKSDAAASDDFSKRVPNGPIIEPPAIARAVRTPTSARSTLNPTQFVLPNGIKVIVQEKHDRPTFFLRGEIASSPGFAPPGKEGMLRLASSVADYGSENYPFAQRHKVTDELGAFVQTGQRFSARGLVRDFSQIAGVVADGEAHPSFAEPWFSLERDQLANSLQTEAHISGVLIDRAYLQHLLTTTDPSLREPTPQSVSSISRDDLLTFAHTYWRPDLTTIAIVGDITPAQARSVLTQAFGGWTAGGTPPNPHEAPLAQAQSGHEYIGTEASQVYVRLGQPAVARNDPDYDAFLVLNQILGASGAFESRLWQELRQKRGLVYSATSTLNADDDRGDFRIEIDASPNRVVEAVRFVRSELRRMQDQPVSAVELSEAKNRLVSDALLDEVSAESQVQQLLDIARNDLPLDYYRTLNDHFTKITAQDVQRVAKRYLVPDRLIEIYSGPSGVWSDQSL